MTIFSLILHSNRWITCPGFTSYLPPLALNVILLSRHHESPKRMPTSSMSSHTWQLAMDTLVPKEIWIGMIHLSLTVWALVLSRSQIPLQHRINAHFNQ